MRGARAGKKREREDTKIEAKIRLDTKHHKVISMAADALGLDIASYVRRAALKEAHADLAELQKSSIVFPPSENITRLTEEESSNFLKYIESKPKPNERLRVITAKYYGK